MIRNKQEIENLYNYYEAEMQPDMETEETCRLRKKIIEETAALEKELTEKQKDKMEHILELVNERSAEEFKEVFIYAFSLATRLFTAGLNAE